MSEIIQFQSEKFNYSVATLKGEQHYFIEGYISTIDPDLVNEVITAKAQQELTDSAVGQNITMDVEHSDWFEEEGGVTNPNNTPDKILSQPKSTIPIAKIVSATLKPRGTWVKAEINKNVSKFKEVWGSIKDGFLHSFSIAGYPLKAVTKLIDGVERTLVDSYRLINVTLTGSPVNPSATFVPVMKAALLKSMEANNMAEEEVVEEVVAPVVTEEVKVEEPVVPEPVKVQEVKTGDDVVSKITEERDALIVEKSKLAEDKAALEQQLKQAQAPVVETSATDNNSESSGPMSQIKALTNDKIRLESEIATLKAELAKPVMKAQLSREQPKMKQTQNDSSPMDLIN